MVKIYYSNDPLENDYLTNNFPNAINTHILEKQNLKNKMQSKRSWELLRLVLSQELNMDIRELNIEFNENGKPTSNRCFFSISHSYDVSVVAISDQNIGVDVEQIIIDENKMKLAKKLIKKNRDITIVDFYLMFTGYEALMKYYGKSLGYPKNKLIFSDEYCNEIIEIDKNKYMIAYTGKKTDKIKKIRRTYEI